MVRQPRTCWRCGRTGVNAFRSLRGAAGGDDWVCAHEDPCLRRLRTRRRATAREADGRPRTSPIAPPDLSERVACVIGSDDEATTAIAAVLADYAAMQVDRLGLECRTLDLLVRRDYGLVVLDARADDPVALLNELGRRLAAARRRDVASVVVHGDGPVTPTLELLCAASEAPRVRRPFDVPTLLAAVAEGTGVGATPVASSM